MKVLSKMDIWHPYVEVLSGRTEWKSRLEHIQHHWWKSNMNIAENSTLRNCGTEVKHHCFVFVFFFQNLLKDQRAKFILVQSPGNWEVYLWLIQSLVLITMWGQLSPGTQFWIQWPRFSLKHSWFAGLQGFSNSHKAPLQYLGVRYWSITSR